MYRYLLGREVAIYTEVVIFEEADGKRIRTFERPLYLGTGRVTTISPLIGLTIHRGNECIHVMRPWTRARNSNHRMWLREWYSQISGIFRGEIVLMATYGYTPPVMKEMCRSINA